MKNTWTWQTIRDVILFFVGLGGIIAITVAVLVGAPLNAALVPQLLLVFAAMAGLPVVLRADERRRGHRDNDS